MVLHNSPAADAYWLDHTVFVVSTLILLLADIPQLVALRLTPRAQWDRTKSMMLLLSSVSVCVQLIRCPDPNGIHTYPAWLAVNLRSLNPPLHLFNRTFLTYSAAESSYLLLGLPVPQRLKQLFFGPPIAYTVAVATHLVVEAVALLVYGDWATSVALASESPEHDRTARIFSLNFQFKDLAYLLTMFQQISMWCWSFWALYSPLRRLRDSMEQQYARQVQAAQEQHVRAWEEATTVATGDVPVQMPADAQLLPLRIRQVVSFDAPQDGEDEMAEVEQLIQHPESPEATMRQRIKHTQPQQYDLPSPSNKSKLESKDTSSSSFANASHTSHIPVSGNISASINEQAKGLVNTSSEQKGASPTVSTARPTVSVESNATSPSSSSSPASPPVPARLVEVRALIRRMLQLNLLAVLVDSLCALGVLGSVMALRHGRHEMPPDPNKFLIGKAFISVAQQITNAISLWYVWRPLTVVRAALKRGTPDNSVTSLLYNFQHLVWYGPDVVNLQTTGTAHTAQHKQLHATEASSSLESPLDSQASHAPSGLSMRSGMTSIKAVRMNEYELSQYVDSQWLDPHSNNLPERSDFGHVHNDPEYADEYIAENISVPGIPASDETIAPEHTAART